MTARLVLPANHVEVFDTTLRDGMQVEGVSASVVDKLRIAEQLDHLGVHYIEGGWPGANPKDEEFFQRARTELSLRNSMLVAFGSTRRPMGRVDDDAKRRDAKRGCVLLVICHHHELLRTILFYYNRLLISWYNSDAPGSDAARARQSC